jgi:hypothetical protein
MLLTTESLRAFMLSDDLSFLLKISGRQKLAISTKDGRCFGRDKHSLIKRLVTL